MTQKESLLISYVYPIGPYLLLLKIDLVSAVYLVSDVMKRSQDASLIMLGIS